MCLSDVTNPWSPAKATKRKAQDPPSVSYLKASPQSKKRKFDAPFKLTKEISINESAPFNMALGQMGARYFHNVNSELETLFKVIANGDNPMKDKIFDVKT